MADEVQYASGADSASHKRKYEDPTTPSSAPRRATGFSAPISSQSPPVSYNNVPPPVDDFELAKQKAQEIAARLLNSSVDAAKRTKFENGASAFDSTDGKDLGQKLVLPGFASSMAGSYGYPAPSKKIEIPNDRVGVIIGKAGETIKYLQVQSGAKIQVTRDADADLTYPTRTVELTGTAEAIEKAERLINEVLSEAEAGGSGIVSRRFTGQQPGMEQFVMAVPNNKVGLVIGKGGETIKNMQARSGARIQVIPLHLPPGDTSKERTVQIDGSSEQIEAAKQLVNEVLSENRLRNSSMGGVYPQQYQARPPTNWAAPGPPMQQPGYAYPGTYPGPSPQYNMTQPPYPGYPPQPTSGGFATGWEQTTSAPHNQPSSQGGGYDYYQQPPSQQPQSTGGSTPSTDNTGYGYNQPPTSAYNQQGYPQDSYGGGYHTTAQTGYGQPQSNQSLGYDQLQGYNSAAGYNSVSNPASEGQTPTYGSQGGTNQAPAAPQSSVNGQQGYSAGQQTSSNASYPHQGTAQPAYGMTPSQTGYGIPPSGYSANYGQPQAQKPPVNQPAYGQPQQSPSAQGSYGQSAPMQPGYPHSQPATAQSGYAQSDSGAQRAPSSSYGMTQPGYGAPPYDAPSATQASYGQQQPPPYSSTYAGGYTQPPVYSSDGSSGGSARGTYDAAPAQQSTLPSNSVAKASPKS